LTLAHPPQYAGLHSNAELDRMPVAPANPGDANMTREARLRKIHSYGNGYDALMNGLQRFPQEMWDYRDEHGCWSIREHLVHIADSEANSYIRCRRLIAEPGEPLMAYDENAWSRSLNYSDQGIDDALALFRLLRSQTYTLIQSLPDAVWTNTCHHPENGDMSLDDWLAVYEAHIPEHLQFMQENCDAWRNNR
jgi:hypothetical protein